MAEGGNGQELPNNITDINAFREKRQEPEETSANTNATFHEAGDTNLLPPTPINDFDSAENIKKNIPEQFQKSLSERAAEIKEKYGSKPEIENSSMPRVEIPLEHPHSEAQRKKSVSAILQKIVGIKRFMR